MDGLSIMMSTELEMCSGLGAKASCCQTDSDHESVLSDYSEMADPVKEHLASIHLLQEAELRFGGLLGMQQSCGLRPLMAIQRRPDEDEVDFFRRQRKMNFLSLAQEFAAIKKVNSEALPFNLHIQKNYFSPEEEDNDTSNELSLAQELSTICCVDKVDEEVAVGGIAANSSKLFDGCSGFRDVDYDECICKTEDGASDSCLSRTAACVVNVTGSTPVDTFSCSMPDVVRGLQNDKRVEASLQPDVNCIEVRSAVGDHSSDVVGRTDADLKVMDAPASIVTSASKGIDLMRQRERENIRLKLVVADDDDGDVFGCDKTMMLPCDPTLPCPASCASLRMCYVNEAAFEDDDDDYGYDYGHGLACREPIAKPLCSPDLISGMNRDAQQKFVSCEDAFDSSACTDPAVRQSTELCQNWSRVPDVGVMEWKLSCLDSMSLQRLNVAQLQVIFNDQLSQIEALNTELVESLMERDDLHRVQDSLLVDIEDLTGSLAKATSTVALPIQSERLPE